MKKECPCVYDDCPRHADCEACKKYHHSRSEKTTCEKSKQIYYK